MISAGWFRRRHVFFFRAGRMLLWILSFHPWLCQECLDGLCLRCDCFPCASQLLQGKPCCPTKRCSSSSMRATALLWVLQTPKTIKCLKYQMLVNIIYNKIFPYLVSFLENKMLVSFYLQGSCVNKLLFLKYFICHQEWQNKIQACLRCIQSYFRRSKKSIYSLQFGA